jgi:hypothetical protein
MDGRQRFMDAMTPTAAVKVIVADDGSGVEASSLYYVWTGDGIAPVAGWKSFVNGQAVHQSGKPGNWYLHIRATDQAGKQRKRVSSDYVRREVHPCNEKSVRQA